MKVVNRIVQYILATILGLSILTLIIINIASSTVLNESYIFSKLKEEKYYDEVYEQTKSNFEKYIYQSGLDESVIEDLVSKDKIEKDTKIILNSIYDGIDEKVETDSINEKLNKNIKDSLNGNISSSQKKAIDDFVEKICEEYEDTILSTKYNAKANSVIKTINQYIQLINKILYIVSGVSFILIIILSIKKIYKVLARLGFALTVDGLILIIVKAYIFSKVNIYGITILGESATKVLKSIFVDIFEKISIFSWVMLIVGIILIIIYGIIKGYRRSKLIKERYTPEN